MWNPRAVMIPIERLSLWQPLMPPVSWIGVCFVSVSHSPSETKEYHPSSTQITQLYALLIAHWTNSCRSLRWRHNYHDGVSNHQPHGCLLNRLFRRRSKKTSKIRVTGLCAGNSPGPVNSPHKGPVTRKMFPFDDVIMYIDIYTQAILLTLRFSVRRKHLTQNSVL